MYLSKLTAGLLGVCLLISLGGTPSDAQQRLQIQNNTYVVTIVSEFGIPVRVGIFGYSTNAQVRIDFDGGRTGPDVYDQELIAGERVVFVWDQRQRPLLVATVNVNSSGTLVVGPNYYGQAGAAGANPRTGAAEAAGPNIPKLELKPRN